MKTIIVILMILGTHMYGWEINTHRAIERQAIKYSQNLETFVTNSGISKNSSYYNYEKFEGYGSYTYINYILYGEKNGISNKRWNQKFYGTESSYKKMIEAGAILEDSVYAKAPLSFNGRFNNHFYDAQNGGHALTLGYGIRVNALKWGTNGTHVGNFLRENKYSYLNTLNYFLKGFTEANPNERRKYQAKMFVALGHLLHLMNDLTSPAHTRDDSHPFGDAMEEWGRGGEDGKQNMGYKIVGNSLDDDAGIIENKATNMPKYSKFSDFITKEATWTATHFFSNDTIYTKPRPSRSDTYEFIDSVDNGVTQYYIKSDGTGNASCNNGCVPVGTKLAIGIKSWIINKLELYYPERAVGKTTTFKGDYSVLKENARILIPRAIANARNFLNYFFRGQISVAITDDKIVIKNVSNTSLVAQGTTVLRSTSSSGSAYSFKYEDDDGTLHPLFFTYNRTVDNSDIVDNTSQPNSPTNVLYPTIDLNSGNSLEAHIVFDDATRLLIRNKKVIVNYYGGIGRNLEKGVATCYASTPRGGIAHRE